MLTYWKKLEKTQYLSLRELQEIQWQRLEKMYAFLWKNNAFFRNRFLQAGLTPNSLKEPADITKLPILTKEQIRESGDLMISEGFDKSSLLHFKTGGSTGKALDIFLTNDCSSLRNACTRRHDIWTGWRPGEPIAAVWGNPYLPGTLKAKIKNNFVLPYIYLDTMAVDDQAVYDFSKKWINAKPSLLFGHAHSLFILAQHVNRLGIKDMNPTGILSTSMMLLPHERQFIERVFHCKVTDRYGCEEVSLIGSECEQHSGMHLNIEHLVIEFIKDDSTPARLGEPGKIVITDLMNYAMPFIRYQVEDVGTQMNKSCPCGRGLPLMGKVEGRIADFLIKNDGTKVAGISLIENTLTKIPGIDQMQIIQKTVEDFKLNIVPGRQYSIETKKHLIKYFSNTFPESKIDILEIDNIPPEPSGKYRFSICKLGNS